MSTIKFNFFRLFCFFILYGEFLYFCYNMIRSQLEGADAHHTFRVDSAGEGHLRVPKPERPPSRSHPVGHGTRVTSSMCNAVDFWLYTAVLRMKRCAELISAYFAYVEMNHQEAPENEVPDIKLPFTVFRISGFL